MTAWQGFFTAEVGASATLAGLIFVGVSLNLKIILQYPQLPNRALEGLVALVLILMIASLMLVPGQAQGIQGSEVTGLGVVGWLFLSVMYARELPTIEAQYRRASLPRIILAQLATLLFLAAGIVVIVAGSVGFYVVVPAVLCSFLLAFYTSWILLIEINR